MPPSFIPPAHLAALLICAAPAPHPPLTAVQPPPPQAQPPPRAATPPPLNGHPVRPGSDLDNMLSQIMRGPSQTAPRDHGR